MIALRAMQDEAQYEVAPAVPKEVQNALRKALQGKRENGETQDYQVELPSRRPPDGEAAVPPQLDIVFLILKLLFYLVVAAGLVGLVVAATRSFLGRRQRDEASEPDRTAESALAGAAVEVDLKKVRALADRGDFGDAIHLLLLLTFQSLCDLAGTELRPAWTSREILREIPLPEAAQQALRSLVTAVELSHFGGVEPTRADFELALNRFESFVATLRNGRLS
jgi:uncharacterized protein DUF4129